MRVLFVTLERRKWRKARQLSYGAQLGYEEGFRSRGIECLTLAAPWLSRARSIVGGRRFDQVWLELVHTEFPDERFLSWIAGLAPVRIGYVQESLDYTAEECARWPDLAAWTRWKQKVEDRLDAMTHVLAGDERDAERLSARRPALWWPQAVPARFVVERVPPDGDFTVVFAGSVYGERAALLERPELRGLVEARPSREHATTFPARFDRLHRFARVAAHPLVPGARFLYGRYLRSLRRLREESFRRWLETLGSGGAVLNLPQFFKAYAGRVVEGMAAGRPVLAAAIPDRPRARRLFRDGEEILLFDPGDPAQFSDHVRRLVGDRPLAIRLAEQALERVRRFHTTEKRIEQILRWVETGAEPAYE